MEARNLKMREYGTDVLSHPEHNVVNYEARTRYNNNVRSNVFHNEPDHAANAKLAAKRTNTFAEKPLASQVTRASYQDSNIFGYKDNSAGVVQKTAVNDAKEVRMRSTGTFQSQVFGGDASNGANVRNSNTFKSGVFGDPI